MAKYLPRFVLLFVLCGRMAGAEATRLPDDVRAALQKEHDFTVIKKVNLIPAKGLAAFQAGQDDHDFKMAEPKGSFQTGKAAANTSLPPRQLQFAELSKDYLLIHHARGGIALGYYFVLLKKSGPTFKVIWVGEGSRCSSFHRFVKGLKTDAIDDRPGYAY